MTGPMIVLPAGAMIAGAGVTEERDGNYRVEWLDAENVLRRTRIWRGDSGGWFWESEFALKVGESDKLLVRSFDSVDAEHEPRQR